MLTDPYQARYVKLHIFQTNTHI